MEKEGSRIGVYLVMNIGNQMVVHMVIIVQNIIQEDSQEDMRFVDQLVITLLNVPIQSSRRPRMLSGMTLLGKEDVEWQDQTCQTEEYEASKGKKGKGKKSKSKGKSKGKGAPRSITPRPTQSQTPRNDRPHPKAKPEACSCMTDDFLFAMMSAKSKPTWRHSISTWNGLDYMLCAVVEPPQKKLLIFKTGKWSLSPQSRIALYGHDAKSMKNFTLHLDSADQCDALDRLWFGEMWFPVKKYVYQVQASIAQDPVLDPADLDLEPGHSEPELLPDHKSEIQHTHYLTVAPHTCYLQDTCFQKEPDPLKSRSI